MTKVETDMVRVMRRLTITVRYKRQRELRFRVWLAMQLFGLAAWIANTNIEILPISEEATNG